MANPNGGFDNFIVEMKQDIIKPKALRISFQVGLIQLKKKKRETEKEGSKSTKNFGVKNQSRN